ncbi:hypothetical protein B0H17DRAFT_1105897 [Mycena rosella]|uniref:Uncharacterized protein n=1 Tax=Mycena rosella TaxID=1033263 RepID=A0AAD7FS64_MYCRO|nr:hypothetical protein B0H17DRAFT_1105897 [Mycena rosella]
MPYRPYSRLDCSFYLTLMPAAKRTKEAPPPPPLLDITSLVDIQHPLTVADGRKRKRASAFRVTVRSDAFDGGVEECFLKIVRAHSLLPRLP